MMVERYEFFLFLVVLVCCGNGVGERVHLKIIVPHLIKHHTHTHTVYVHKKPKPYYFGPPIYHNYHKHPYKYSTIYGRNYFRKPSPPRYAPDYPITKLIPVVSKPIFVVNPGPVDDGGHDLYSVSEDPTPADEEFEKIIKQHKYKDINDYKKVHKKEEYDFKKGKKFERHHDKDYDFGHEDGKHGKNLFGYDGHYIKNDQRLQSGDYKVDPNLVVFTEKSPIVVSGPEYNNVLLTADVPEGIEEHQGLVEEEPTVGTNGSNDYVYDGGIFLDVNPVNDNNNNLESDYVGSTSYPNDEEGLKQYEVTENYSDEPENSAPAPEEEKGDFKDDDQVITVTDQPHSSEEELKKETDEDGISQGKFLEESHDPSESSEWSDGYDSVKDETLKDIEAGAKEPDISSSDSKSKKVRKNNKTNKVNKTDRIKKTNKANNNIIQTIIPSQQDDDFMKWAIANGAFGLGYSKDFQLKPQVQGQASQKIYTFYSPYRYGPSGIIRG